MPEPLGVWDTRGVESTWLEHMGEASEWARVHIPDAVRTYRAEFYLFDAPFAVVHRYKLDDSGHKFAWDPGQPPVTDPPVIVPLAELPPERLLKG
jgi:hypothetical protein